MRCFLVLITSYLVFTVSSNSTAQITPDRSLPNNSVITEDFEITGGTTAGDNLFHSFEAFSLSAGETAFFNHNLAIENIISRVTGNNASMIDGLIRSLGDANLFLINPNGIIFGENAALDVGGSFIGSTANSIQFADGSEFSAVATETEPLLTVSIPVGLQYGNNPGDITIQGTGNNLSIDFETFTVDRSNRPEGLSVSRGETLALVGGDVFLPGGNLTASEGRIVVGSVADSGLVKLTPDTLGWNFNYEDVTTFGEINLSQAASVEVSGNRGGEAFLQGRAISIRDGSAILADTLGNGAGRILEIVATESVELTGSATNNLFPTRLSTDVNLNALGDGGNLSLTTNDLLIADGAQVTSGTFGLGDAGNLRVNASEIEVIGESVDGAFVSGLFAQADVGDTGRGGNLTIETDYLLVDEGAQISTTTFGFGDAGNLTVTASEIELIGTAGEFASGLFVVTEAVGDGGNLQIITDNLLVADGAEIATTTFGSGDAGNLTITASAIELIGGESRVSISGILANVNIGIEATGNGGNIDIQTNSLLVAKGARIEASTNNVGDAGTVNIDSQEINLVGTPSSSIPNGIFAVANRSEGAGGNVIITTENLNLSQGAQIATSTSGSGNGGDLEIVARNSISLSGSSDFGSSGLFANAIASDGSGGNITVNTNSLSLTDGATISVSNFPSSSNSPFPPGEGAAGNININATEMVLNDRATITADTFTGDRGNLNLTTDLLRLRQASRISTDAQGTATGGNITIDARDGFLVAAPSENSDITANAVFGAGGRVDISALEIFGIQPRESLTLLSDITASSEFGIAGNIVLNTQDLNPVEELTELPNNLTPPQLAQGCQVAENSNSSFTNIGQGGLNPQPDQVLGSEDELLGDVQLPRQWTNNQQIVEAQGWVVDEQGKITLVANVPTQSIELRCEH